MFNFAIINYLAVFVSTLVANVIGAVWFGPKTFFRFGGEFSAVAQTSSLAQAT